MFVLETAAGIPAAGAAEGFGAIGRGVETATVEGFAGRGAGVAGAFVDSVPVLLGALDWVSEPFFDGGRGLSPVGLAVGCSFLVEVAFLASAFESAAFRCRLSPNGPVAPPEEVLDVLDELLISTSGRTSQNLVLTKT